MHVLITPRLTLRQPALPDAEDIALHLSDWNVTRMLSRVPFPYAVADAERWIASLAGNRDALVYSIHRERLIGMVSIEPGEDGPALGYWLGRPWHGRGYMSEAAGALLAHGFATRGFRAVRSSVFVDNAASLAVQAKLGFEVTGAGTQFSCSRGEDVATWNTRLRADAFEALSMLDTRSAA